MSKFFNQTQKAQDWALREGMVKDFDLEGLLNTVKETVKTADTVATDLSARRLEGCEKISLPHSTDSKTIFSGSEYTTTIALESYRALRTRLMRLQAAQGLHSIVLSSAIPGEGKTLTSLNLALTCAQIREQRVLLIDADLRTSGLTKLLQAAPGPGLAEVLAGEVPIEAAIAATDLPNLFVLRAGNSNVPPTELFAGVHWKELLGWCSETFRTVLVDSPPILTLADFELISAACDGVLVVVRAMHTQRELLKKASAQVDSKKLLGIVFNGAIAGGRNDYQNAGYYIKGNGAEK